MSQRLDRLIQLLEMKQELTKKAYQQLLDAQEQFKKNKLKHDQLVSYRQDYLRQLESLVEQGTVVGQVRSRVDFISHLDAALAQLNGYLAALAKERTKAELAYKQAKIAEEGVSLMIDRLKKRQLSRMHYLEQKESDEYAQKKWYSNEMNE